MAHKLTLRLEDSTWAGFEAFLASEGITATAYLEAHAMAVHARFVTEGSVDNWTGQLNFQMVVTRAREIDRDRRRRAPQEHPAPQPTSS